MLQIILNLVSLLPIMILGEQHQSNRRIFSRHYLRLPISVFLLVIYVTGSTLIDVAHHSIHNHGIQDGHVVKYDHSKKGMAFFAEALEECQFSHVVFQANQLLTVDQSNILSADKINFPFAIKPSHFNVTLRDLQLRGPPVL